jgi:class 3 adenylate cyclase/CHASE1-domain containing sensor protein
MIFFKELSNLSLKRYILLSALVIFEIFATVWLYNTLKEKEDQMLSLEFESQSKEITTAIQKEISVNLEKIASLNALYSVAYPISRENFKTFTKHLIFSNSSIHALSWIPKITYKEKELFETKIRNMGFLEFCITESAGKKLVPVAKRPVYYPVYFIEPFTGNEIAFGYDLASNPIRLKAMEKANLTNQMAATARINLVQVRSSDKGLLVIYPFKQKGELIGYFTGVFRIHDLITRAIGELPGKKCNIVVYDISADKGDQLLAQLSVENQSLLNDDHVFTIPEGMHFLQTIKIADREWLIEMTPTQNYLNSRSDTSWLILLLCIAISVGLFYHLFQYFKSENLLLNILPAEIAHELKANGKSDARYFESATILFSDFKDFTETAARLTAPELVEEINYCFKGFDSITEKFKIEKIKTIGDAYMAAGGLPIPNIDSVRNTVLAAIEMQDFMIRKKAQNEAANKTVFEMRVGVHTGPVVAGIVGVKKFQYDIWGDTVNTAYRVENVGETGKVNISQATYELIKDDATFSFESRGKIEVKGKGEIEMWFVEKVV